MKFVLYSLACFLCGGQATLPSTDTCDDVKSFYTGTGVADLILSKPEVAGHSSVCNNETVTCCNEHTETMLYVESMKDVKRSYGNSTLAISEALRDARDKLDRLTLNLIEKSRTGLDTLFSGTYQNIYTDNKAVFIKFYDDIRTYYKGGNVDLADIFDSLFSSLTQLAFKLFPGYDMTEEYGQCIADNMNLIKPFADLPKKLETQVQRAFLAVRAYSRALTYGQRAINGVTRVYPTRESINEYTALTHCAKCAGHTVEGPCLSLCTDTIQKFLCSVHGDFGDTWRRYTDSMNSILDRIESPFNIEAALLPIDVKISEGIMLLQDNQIAIADAVERHCGPIPKASLSSVTNSSLSNGLGGFDLSGLSLLSAEDLSNDPYGESSDEADLRRSKRSARGRKGKRKHSRRAEKSRAPHKVRDVTASKRGHDAGRVAKRGDNLKSLMYELRGLQRSLVRYWSGAPGDICSRIVTNGQGQCWNGHALVPVAEGDSAKKARCPAKSKPDPMFRREVYDLKEVTGVLAQAYRGIDTSMPDTEMHVEGIDGSGEGSGDDAEPDHGVNSAGGSKQNHEIQGSGDKSVALENLEKYEVVILEKALSRSIKQAETMEHLKQHVLKKHPHLKRARHADKPHKVEGLSEHQVVLLKKLLEIEDKVTRAENPSFSTKAMRATTITNAAVTTTSNSVRLRPGVSLMLAALAVYALRY